MKTAIILDSLPSRSDELTSDESDPSPVGVVVPPTMIARFRPPATESASSLASLSALTTLKEKEKEKEPENLVVRTKKLNVDQIDGVKKGGAKVLSPEELAAELVLEELAMGELFPSFLLDSN